MRSYGDLAQLALTNLIDPINCDKRFVQSPFFCLPSLNAFYGLITRRILEINPKDFETVPSGVSGLYFQCSNVVGFLFLTFLAEGAEGSAARGAVLPVRLVSYQRQSHHGRSAARTF